MNVQRHVTGAWLVVFSCTLGAQAKPDLAGTWVLDHERTAAVAPSRSTAPGGAMARAGGAMVGGSLSPSGSAPPEWTIVVSAAAVTVERSGASGGQKYLFKLDGSESINVNGRTTLTTKTRWDAGKLLTEGSQSTKTDQGDVVGTFKEVRWIAQDGALFVETTRQTETNPPTTLTQVYVRKKS